MKISILTLFTFLFSIITLNAECIIPSDHEKVSYLLIDRSDKLETKDSFLKSIKAFSSMIEEGERVIVGLSTGKASETKVLMDFVKPKGSVWVSMLKTRADTKKFDKCLQEVTENLADKEEEHKSSALLETLAFVGKVLSTDTAKEKRLFVYSDMMQNSESISFYGIKPFDPEKALTLTKKAYLFSKLHSVSIYIAGTGQTISDAQSRKLEAYWDKYFENSGGVLKFYGPILIHS